MSLRLKIILGIGLIGFCLLSILVVSNHWHLKRTIEAQLADRARGTAELLAAMATDPLSEHDHASLDSLVRHAIAADNVAFVRIRDADGRQLAAGGDAAALFRRESGIAAPAAEGSFGAVVPVVANGARVGQIELGFATATVATELRESLGLNLGVAVAEVSLVAVLGYLLGAFLTRKIALIRHGAERIGRGDYGFQLELRGGDEFGQAAASFNAMSTRLAYKRDKSATQKQRLERLALIADRADEGMFITDSNGLIEWVNEGCERLTGYRAEELIGQSPHVIFERARYDGERVQHTLGRLAAGEVVRSDVQIYTKSGKPLWVALGLTPVFDDARNLVQVLAVQRDVTRRHWLEMELKAHREHLERMVERRTTELEQQKARLQDALEAQKSLNVLQRAFVAMVSHEFRTPLAIIDAAAKRMKRRAEQLEPAETVAITGKITHSVVRMVRMIEGMLTVERIEGGELEVHTEDCDIGAILRLCHQRQQELSPDHDIRLALGSLPPTIRADPSVVEQVVTNLLSNAVKYAPDDPLIEARAEQQGEDVVISVADHGVGIDADDLPNMFNRFFRAKTSAGIAGTGIDLLLVKLMVERHEGSISVDSRPGEGTRFEVRLPVAGPCDAGQKPRAGAVFQPTA